MKKIVLVFILFCQIFTLYSQDVLTISGEAVSLEEFVHTLMKNNKEENITKEYLDNYINLFINYKLKVFQAKELGIHDSKEFIDELDMYRKQLAKPYLQDLEYKDNLIQEAYERMKLDVHVSHILLRLDPASSPEDTLKKYNLGKKIYRMIESGEISFVDAVKKYSDEKYNNGDLGYFTVFDMIYPFESAAYSTPIGSVSDLVRTKYGYHLLMVHDRRSAFGDVKVSHIMCKLSNGASQDHINQKKLKIEEVYKRLTEGESFASLADKYSEDRSTAVRGGSLPWFGINKMAKEFENAAFSIEEIGDYTTPFRTQYGWHIVILDDKKQIGDFEDVRSDIENNILKGSRGLLGDISMIKKLKKEYNFKNHKYNIYRKRKVKESIDETKLLSAQLTAQDLVRTKLDSRSLFFIDDYQYSQNNFKDFILENQEEGQTFDFLYNMFVDYSLLEYEESNLEEKYPEYRLLINEFRDGMLLFELTSSEVWNKAIEDTLGLERFFIENRSQYIWPDRVSANIYKCLDRKVSTELKRFLWKKRKGMITTQDIIKSVNQPSPLNLQVETDVFAFGQNRYIDSIGFILGTYEIFNDDQTVVVVEIEERLDSNTQELDEVRGKVISDYQDHLESSWVEDLRSLYDIDVNYDVLYSIIK